MALTMPSSLFGSKVPLAHAEIFIEASLAARGGLVLGPALLCARTPSCADWQMLGGLDVSSFSSPDLSREDLQVVKESFFAFRDENWGMPVLMLPREPETGDASADP